MGRLSPGGLAATARLSGIVTFIVNHDGVVYQKDPGAETAGIAQALSKFDPDSSWKKVKRSEPFA